MSPVSEDDAAEQVRAYHHGQLKTALIQASDEILRESGIEGFSMREAARRAGVSPGAPAHQFGSITGLLTEVALLGYEELGRTLAAAEIDGSHGAQLRSLAAAYVQFAQAHPGRFRLMFRKDLVNRQDPRYQAVTQKALSGFFVAALRYRGIPPEGAQQARSLAVFVAAWSAAHGLAHLALEDKMDFALDKEVPADFAQRLLPDLLFAQWPDI